MPKKTKKELEAIQSFVNRTYNRYGNLLLVNTEKLYDPRHTALGYCFKHKDPKSGNVIYKIECSTVGIPDTDYRILMHEYGHIYLGHLDGINEELDSQICSVFRDHRAELIASINESCGIDFGDKLIERVIDDPELNHSLHNIAMDFEVNSKILSAEDVEEMEKDLTSILPKTDEELLKYMADHAASPEEKKQYQDVLDKMQKETKIKLMIPERYNLGVALDSSGNPILKLDDSGQPIVDPMGNPVFETIPFPNDLKYSEYLLLIIEHLDQFVKMLVSIQMGGNGDTSQISQRDVQNILQKAQNQWDQRSEAYKQGYNDALNDFKNNQLGKQQNSPQNQLGGQQGQNDAQQNQGQQGQGQQNQGQSGQQGQQGQQGQGQSSSGGMQGDSSSSNGGQSGGTSGSQSGQGASGGQGSSQSSAGGSGAQNDYNQGYKDAIRDLSQSGGQGGGMQGLSDLMNQNGMSDDQSNGQGQQGQQGQNGQNSDADSSGDGNGSSGKKYEGERPPISDADHGQDHRTDSRDEADRKRELGQISSAGGFGCGASGGPDATRQVNKDLDEVDMALKEVMTNIRHKVVKVKPKKDNLKLYNRGVTRRGGDKPCTMVPSRTVKTTFDIDPTIVFLIDISGSMDTNLIDRILLTINNSLRKMHKGLKYNIITWSTHLGEHIQDINPKKGVPRISCGGGTRMAEGIKYFKEHYDEKAILVVISDFEDYLDEWHSVEQTMPKYDMYGFNYGSSSYSDSDKINWSHMKIRKFKNR